MRVKPPLTPHDSRHLHDPDESRVMKILIVDDSKAMRMIVARTLNQTDLSGFTKIEASNGVEALEKIEQESPDLVLSDWNMPEMKGIELS